MTFLCSSFNWNPLLLAIVSIVSLIVSLTSNARDPRAQYDVLSHDFFTALQSDCSITMKISSQKLNGMHPDPFYMPICENGAGSRELHVSGFPTWYSEHGSRACPSCVVPYKRYRIQGQSPTCVNVSSLH